MPVQRDGLRWRAHRRRLHNLAQTVANHGAAMAPADATAPADVVAVATHLVRLERDGVTIVDDVFSAAQISAFSAKLAAAWGEVQAALPTQNWRTMRYKPSYVEAPSFAVGKALYEGHQSTEYRGTEVINMGRGRYDLFGGLLRGGSLESATKAPVLTAIADVALHCDTYSAVECPGALPTFLPYPPATRGSANEVQAEEAVEDKADRGGLWHRDAYPLFEDEALDISLPRFYISCLAVSGIRGASDPWNLHRLPFAFRT